MLNRDGENAIHEEKSVIHCVILKCIGNMLCAFIADLVPPKMQSCECPMLSRDDEDAVHEEEVWLTLLF